MDDARPDAQTRSLGPPGSEPGPLSLPTRNEVTPNSNEPLGSVGSNVPVDGDPSAQFGWEGGYGSQHVLYPSWMPTPPHWAGWPVDWTPAWNGGGYGSPYWTGGSDIAYSAISLNAAAVADMPRVVSKNLVRQPTPSWMDNPQKEVYQSGLEAVRQIWWSYQGCGEVFLIATSRYADGYPRSFVMLDPWLVQVELRDGVRTYSINGEPVSSGPGGDLCHIRYDSWPGEARGHGPLEHAGDRITAARVLSRYAADLAGNGGIPWAVLTSTHRITPAQAQKLKADWIEAARSRMGAPAILDQELTLTPLNVTPKDMALADLQAAAEARIAVILGVPPYMLGLPTPAGGLTYVNAQQVFEFHWKMTLRPHSTYVMRAISDWALPSGTEIVLDASGYTEPAPLERVQFYEKMLAMNAMSVDEIRAAERLAPLGSAPAALPTVAGEVATDAAGR